MRHSTLRSRKLLVLPLLALALLAATVDAHAATPAMIQGRTAAWTGNSGATLCTGAPIFSNYSQPGNCKFSGTGGGLFLGQFKTAATLIDATLCPKQTVDPTDVICGHFGMDFSNVQGSVTVGINLDPNNDLDLCVIDSAGTIVNDCSLGTGATESVTFNVKCSDTRYEAQILPISYAFPGPTVATPATFTGNATGSLARCFPGGSEGQGNGKRKNFDHQGKGHGQGNNGHNDDHEKVSSHIEKDNDNDRGKVRYSQPKHETHYRFFSTADDLYTDGCDLRSTEITSTSWNDVTKTMVVTGTGTVNGLDSVPFVFTETDNGPGTSDTYSVDSACHGEGNLTDGSDFTYDHELPVAPVAEIASVVPFGAAAGFAVLAGSAITNTGPSTIFGDLGAFPTPAITGIPTATINGINHGGDVATQAAKTDLVTAYDAAAALTSTTTVGTADIGGRTLTAGVYTSGSSIGLTGTLTLDAAGDPNAVFVFQAGSTLTTAAASKVVLINGAQSRNVFWQVGSSATLGASSTLRGSIIALTSITSGAGTTVDGRLLARNGAVTLDSNTITTPTYAAPAAPPADPAPVAPAPAASIVPFGTASTFAVLAGSAITNTGPSTIFGDLGAFPTPAITGIPTATINGINHGGDVATQAAKTDLVTAYDAAAALTSTTTVGTADIGGQTLSPGVYNSGSSIGLTGTLTLDGGGNPNAVFVFQAGSTLTTAAASKVVLINGAQSCNVFWQVGSSATLGTNSTLKGSIIALTSITATTGATIDGRLLARNGAVTLDTNTITVPTCAA